MLRTTAPTGFFLAFVIALTLFATTPVVAGDYEDGMAAGLARDYQKAFQLLEPAAEQGDARAQYMVGLMYKKGEGIPENDAKAVHWYTESAKQGRRDAQFSLGSKYYMGIGVPQDYAIAAHWYTKAAKQGYTKAQLIIGVMHNGGRGLPKDHVRGYAWSSIAASQGIADGKKVKEIIANRMTPAQIAEAQKLSSELWEKYVVPFQKN